MKNIFKNSMYLYFLLNALLVANLAFSQPLNGTYTINANGSGLRNFTNFTNAVTALKAKGINSSVIFNLPVADTFYEKIRIPLINGVSPSSTITFNGQDKNSRALLYSDTALILDGADHIIFKNLTIETNGLALSHTVIIQNGSDSNEFNGCRIISTEGGSVQNNFSAIYSPASNLLPDNYNKFINNEIINGFYGLYFSGVSSTSLEIGNIFQNNTFKGFYYWGLWLNYQDAPRISSNYFENYILSATVQAIYTSYCNNDMLIEKNKLNLSASSNAYGLNIINSTGTITNHGMIANNFVNIISPALSYGIYSSANLYLNIYYNSINISAGSVTTSKNLNVTTGSNITILNNILTNFSGGYTIYNQTPAAITQSNYNDLYSTGANFAYWGGNLANLAAWRTTSTMDINSVSVNPGFFSITNLHLNNPVLDSAATVIASVTTDIDGQSRNTLKPDIGADEFNLLSKDVGIVSLVNPICAGSCNPIVKIKNYGTSHLDSVTINWSVNGVARTPVKFNVSLNQLSDTNLILGSYTFTSGVSYDLVFWTSLPNGVTDQNAGNDSIILPNSKTAISGSFIISKSGSGNYINFTSALKDLKTYGICGPVTFRADTGTYNEQLLIPEIYGASSANRIVFESLNGDSTSVIISYAAQGAGDNYVIALSGADYITFRKLTLQATGSIYGYVFSLNNGADNNLISNNIIQCAGITTYYYGVYSSGSADNNNIYQYNQFLNGYAGIRVYGISGTNETGTIIRGNIFSNYGYYGIYSYYQDAPQIIDNTLENSTTPTTSYAIYCVTNNNALRILKNNIRISGTAITTTYGIYLSSCTAVSGNEGLLANNFVSMSSPATATAYGIYLSGSNYQDIVYNSVNLLGGSATAGRAIFVTTGGNYFLKNNIFANFAGGYAIYANSTTIISGSDYNDLYTTGPALGWWTSARANLAAWRTASGKDANSKSVDPGFPFFNDLHINNKQLDSAASPYSRITDDIDGDIRNSSYPDIGADEFVSYPNDAGATQLASYPFTIGINMVKVRIKSYGTARLDSVTVNWAINGTVQTPVKFAVSLNQLGDTVLNLANYSFLKGIVYNFKFWTTRPNGKSDPNPSNDTLKLYDLQTALCGNYTIGDSTADFTSFNQVVHDLIAGGVCGPVTFKINDGSYNEQFIIPSITGTSATKRITFESASLDSTKVILYYVINSLANNYVVRLNNADYITFSKMTIKAGAGSSYGKIIELTNGSCNNIISNNIIQSIILNSTNAEYAGIYSGTTIENDNRIELNKITGGQYGIYLNAISASHEIRNIISQNIIKDFYNSGIYGFYQDTFQITGNEITNSANAVQTCYGVNLNTCSNLLKILKNKIFINTGATKYGIYIASCAGTTTKPLIVANNFIRVSDPGDVAYGIYSSNVTYTNYYYNTISLSGQNSTSRTFFMTTGSNINLYNNIFSNIGGGHAIYVNTTSALTGSDYNDLYTSGHNIGSWSTTNITDLADWQTTTLKDIHSISVEPAFYSITDMHTFLPLLDNKGTVVSVTEDIDGEVRNNTHPDIGADEFTAYHNDAGIIELIEPMPPCPNAVSDIVVRLRNFGIDTLFTDSIQWIKNGTQQIPVYFHDTITSGKYKDIKIGNDTFFSNIYYSIKIWSEYPNGIYDTNNANDSLIIKRLHTAMTGTYTIGPSRNFSNFSSAVDMLNEFGVCSPVTFVVDSGIYNEQIAINQFIGTSNSRRVTFQSATGDSTDVILRYSALDASSNYVLSLHGADNVTFKQMTIEATGTNYGIAVVIDKGADNNQFLNNIVKSSNTTDSKFACFWSGSAGTSSGSIIEAKGIASIDNDNLIYNNLTLKGCYSIYFEGSSANLEVGNKFINNTLSNFSGTGIYLVGQDASEVISNNLTGFGISVLNSTLNGIYCSSCNNASVITGNKIFLEGTQNITGINNSSCIGTQINHGLISNNFISQAGISTITVHGIQSTNSRYQDIYHNSILLTTGGTTISSAFYLQATLTTGIGNIIIKNNIASHKGNALVFEITNPSYVQSSDYNDLYTTGSSLGKSGSTIMAALVDWQTQTGFDMNSISINPTFTDSNDLHLTTYNNFRLYNPIPEVPRDIDGTLRSLVKPTVGADERPPYPYDAGIVGFLSPESPSCAGYLPINVSLFNYGTHTIDSVEINWYVNHQIMGTYKFNGLLQVEKDTQLVIGYYNFYADSNYKVIAETNQPDGQTDGDMENNADSIYNIKLYAFPTINSIDQDSICTGNIAHLAAYSNTKKINWYDTLSGGNLINHDTIFSTPILNKSKIYYAEATTFGIPFTYATSRASGLADMGAMFDVTALKEEITIDSFAIMSPMSANSQLPIEIYYKTGSYLGHERDTFAWTRIDSITLTTKGPDRFINVPVGNLKLTMGQTYGFYITSTDFAALMNYTDRAKSDSDNYLRFTPGAKIYYPYDYTPNIDSGKTWNGKIFYSVGSLCRSPRIPVMAFVKPLPDQIAGNDTSFCDGNNIVFSTLYFPEFTYIWKEISNYNTLSTTNTLFADTTGIYTLYVKDQCGYSLSDTIKLTTHAVPSALFSIKDSAQCYRGNSFIFNNQSSIFNGVISNYVWDFGDSTGNNDTNTIHSYAFADTFSVKLKAISGFGCSDSHTVNLVVYPQPVASFTNNQLEQCFRGNFYQFTNTSNVNNSVITKYIWNFGDNISNNDTNTIHSYSNPDSFDVKLIVISDNGCSDSITRQLIVYTMPVADFRINDSTQCLNENDFQFTNQSTINNGLMSYFWKLSDGKTSSDTDLQHRFANPGNYYVQLIVTSDHNCLDTINRNIAVIPSPIVNLGKDTTLKHNQSIVLNAGSGFVSYLWSTSNSTQQITVDTTGVGDVGTKIIWVKVEKDGCFSSDTIIINFIHNDGVEDHFNNFSVKIYPNPTEGIVFIENKLPAGERITITIENPEGKILKTVNLENISASANLIDLHGFDAGLYYIKIDTRYGSQYAKVLIVK